MTRILLAPLYLWAAPLSLAGLLVAWRAGIVRWGWFGGALEIFVRDLGRTPDGKIEEGVYGWVALHEPDGVVVYIQNRFHALRHVQQNLVLGVLSGIVAGALALVTRLRGLDPYWDHPLEIDAREYARRRMGR